MGADLARELPKEEAPFCVLGVGGAEGGAGKRTASEGSRALGESFLSVAVGNFASLSLLGDSWSGACGDPKWEAFERLESKRLPLPCLVHLRNRTPRAAWTVEGATAPFPSLRGS